LGLQLEAERKPGNPEKWSPGFLFDQAQTCGDGSPCPPTSMQKALWDRLDATLERYSAQFPFTDP
jgi:hypothetical protein